MSLIHDLGYFEKRDFIRARLDEFRRAFDAADDRRIFEELVFCILTSAVGPRGGIKGLEAIRDILLEGSEEEMRKSLAEAHKYPERARYIAGTREYLRAEFDFKLKDLILSFDSPEGRRDFFAQNKNIRGIGYVQASHFLRNLGFAGYCILDKNILHYLWKLGVVDSPKPPSTRKRYIEIENRARHFAAALGIDPDELDFLLWSAKTGYMPK
ncbi:MAG: 8-oxoguanine DNA glycosylase [Deltaproteobacteria bacterium]